MDNTTLVQQLRRIANNLRVLAPEYDDYLLDDADYVDEAADVIERESSADAGANQ